MEVRRLLPLAALVPVLAACALGPGSAESRIASCENDLTEEAGDLYGQEPDAEAEATFRRVCTALVAAGMEDATDGEEMTRFLRTHPAVAADLCDVTTNGIYSSLVARFGRPLNGYVTRDDVLKFGGEGCRYAIAEGYGTFGGRLDFAGLVAAHPELAVPFCAAPVLEAYDSGIELGQGVPRERFEKVADRVCLEAIESGVVDYSSGNILAPDVDQVRFRALLVRATRAR